MTLDQAGHLVYGALLTKEIKMKVEPKQLVVVTVAMGNIIFIDAEGVGRGWIEQEAPQFGSLINTRSGEYLLFPRQTFDAEEVRAYLESMGQE
jgi:hypothetical protein